MGSSRKIDKVRASRDGHEFHEAWTARKAIQLLLPNADLIAIAVEGLSPVDQAGAPAAAVEVADLTLYYGQCPSFKDADRTIIVQFKYSIAGQSKNFCASDAKKTVKKFSATYRSFKRKYGAKAVEDKLDFQLITNQPISKALLQAIDAAATGTIPTGDVKKQAEQFNTASGLSGKPLAEFARKLKIIENSGSLPQTKNELASLLVDWSATTDSLAAVRLGKLRELVRDKAGHTGAGQNLIRRTDVLAALQIGDPQDLLPCKAALIDVGPVLEREQLREAVVRLGATSMPLLIHGTGGVGKTVFMDSLASQISTDYEVIFFDCFGGGAYRSPEDARHLPKRGLIHIANTLAFRGLCDLILPDNPDIHTLLSTFRRRLEQCLTTISRMPPGRKLAIFIDAIDNAIFAANQASEDCFPIKLIEALDTKPVDGVKLVVSCRTERKPDTCARLDEFELRPFSQIETDAFLHARLKNVTSIEVNVAQARSGGNPRVLDYLVKADRDLLDPSEINKKIELDDLIQQRITDALYSAEKQGYEKKILDAFLSGLAVLPPPVPLDEYAAAHGMKLAAVESFASDLSPLLERTNHGLMFRDEPTETLIHNRYATSRDTLERVASNLLARQDASVYAARALPRLLLALDDGERLFELAFDDRLPASVTSTVGKRNIRYARLKAATLHAARKIDYNKLVRLLVELSTIAEVDQRGADYLLKHPDLIVAAKDIDARRRLFELRTPWPGTRHARLAIVNILSGDSAEATRHAHANEEWIQHCRRTKRKDFDREPVPNQADIAAACFFQISEGRAEDAADYLTGWQDWYAFEVSQIVLGYTHLASLTGIQATHQVGQFINSLSSIGPLAAALSFHDLTNESRKLLCVKLATLCKEETNLYLPQGDSHQKTYELEDGLRKSAAIALSLGLSAEAQSIASQVRHDRPGVWVYQDAFHRRTYVFVYMFQIALLAAANKCNIHEKDLLPKELVSACADIPETLSGKAFREKAKEQLSKLPRKPSYDDGKSKNIPANAISDNERREAERFLDIRLEPLLALTRALSAAIAASELTIDKRFLELVEAWEHAQQNHDHYFQKDIYPFIQRLGFDVVLFVLWSRSELKPSSIECMLEAVHPHMSDAGDLVRIVAILAQQDHLHSIAGEQAVKARAMIENENEITHRVSLYGALGRAMLPASRDEAAAYFRYGLEQMDAIGSGDDQFTNELLLFASQMKGAELEERDFHTLSNICELNMGEEPEKFFWGAYGHGMAKAAGIRGLAKLGRWDDRNKIALRNTLLPYLTGLVEAGKINSKDALCLNRLANPVEYYFAGTNEFANALRTQAELDGETVTELITQFEDDNPTIANDETLDNLCELATETLGESHDLVTHLTGARGRYGTAREELNIAHGSSSILDPKARREAAERDEANRRVLTRIADATDPTNEASLINAINEFNALGNMYSLKANFFSALRDKVPFAARGQYVRNIANLDHLYFYWKLTELKAAKEAWGESSSALADVYKNLAKPLILSHADDLVDGGQFLCPSINEISEFTGVPIAELVLELIKVFTSTDITVAGSIWLAFASFICPEADEGQGQLALSRLLSSDAARLANNVADGPWKADCYPADDFVKIAARLIWRVLGSPNTVDRWRAAHCIRRFAKFGRWDIVGEVVSLFMTKKAVSFQAPELAFYYLHARLWLLIALARVALDHPDQVARYKDTLLTIIMERDEPHVLIRHFAAKALLICVDRGKLTFDADTLNTVRNINTSSHPRLREKSRDRRNYYQGRPESVPKPSFPYHLEYVFQKHDVDSLGRVFGKDCWEVEHRILDIMERIDSSMIKSQDQSSQSYRQQLSWHALFIAAGKLLSICPVNDDGCHGNDPWKEWFERDTLTRKDGLWLSDGTDRTPDDTSVRLLESKKGGRTVTGDQKKIMGLAGLDIEKGVDEELIVQGRWYSSDGVRIELSSALVPPEKADQLARKLVREDPELVWLPEFHGTENDEILFDEKQDYSPWIVCPAGELRLDAYDPYGVSVANFRPYLARDYSDFCKLTRQDPFGRFWNDDNERVSLRAQAWGRQDPSGRFWNDDNGRVSLRAQAWGDNQAGREDRPPPGLRLFCESNLLKKVLTEYDKNLLLLLKLQRYKKDTDRSSGWFSYSIGVVRIDQALNATYFKGCVNYREQPGP